MIKLLLLFTLFLISTTSNAASFNCDQANTTVEKLICKDVNLSELDNLLDATYTNLRKDSKLENDKFLMSDQNHWLKNVRNRCADTLCLTEAYKLRIDTLDPFADKNITCEKMRKYPQKIFTDQIDLGSGHNSPIEVDYTCPESLSSQGFLKKLLELGDTIRSEVGPQMCMGSIMHAHWRFYHFDLTLAGIAPQELLKQSDYSTADKLLNDYFKQWSNKSTYNRQLYQDFSKEYDQSLIKLSDYYQSKFGAATQSAKDMAAKALLIVLRNAAGDFPHADYKPMSKIVSVASNPDSTGSNLKSALSVNEQSLTNLEIYQALQAALLNNRSSEYISILADKLTSDDFNDLGNEGEPLLSFALQSPKNLRLLLSKGVPVNAENDFGKTALFYAIGLNNLEAVEILLKNKADVNHTYKSAVDLRNDNNRIDECIYPNLGHTLRSPLMHAAQNADVKMLKLLINNGAKLNITDELGFNALDYAVLGKNIQNQNYLKSLGLSPMPKAA